MAKHIGIVGVSAEGAALCYRTICVEGAALMWPHAHPEVSMHTLPLADYVVCLQAGDIEGVGNLMLRSAEKLQSIGADFLVCPDNTVHQAMGHVLPRSPLPWLHIAEVVSAEAKRRQFRKLALTGTQWLVESEVYPEKLSADGIDAVRPGLEDRRRLGNIIMNELVYGDFKTESVCELQHIIARMREEACDAVVLGCTELPLVLNDSNSPLPTLDSTRLLARAALARSMQPC